MNADVAIQRLVDVCRRQHKSLSTERVYSHWLRDYCRFLGTVNHALSSERKMEAWLTMLARKRDVSASTQNQAFNAVLFFYRRVLGQELKDIDGLRAPCRHPRSREWVRWHVLPCNVQRAVQEAAQKLELPITPHCLRHAYATHSLDRGVNLKALSEAMGHAQIETTSGYCHATALSVPSPLELLDAF